MLLSCKQEENVLELRHIDRVYLAQSSRPDCHGGCLPCLRSQQQRKERKKNKKKHPTNFPRQPQYVTTYPGDHMWESLQLPSLLPAVSTFEGSISTRSSKVLPVLLLHGRNSLLLVNNIVFARDRIDAETRAFSRFLRRFRADVSCLPPADHSPQYLDASQAGF